MFAVDPDYQSSGYGGKLLNFAQQYAKVNKETLFWLVQENLKCTTGQVMVISIRDDIIAWYNRMGFQSTGTYEDFPPPEAGSGVPQGDKKLQFLVLRKTLWLVNIENKCIAASLALLHKAQEFIWVWDRPNLKQR